MRGLSFTSKYIYIIYLMQNSPAKSWNLTANKIQEQTKSQPYELDWASDSLNRWMVNGIRKMPAYQAETAYHFFLQFLEVPKLIRKFCTTIFRFSPATLHDYIICMIIWFWKISTKFFHFMYGIQNKHQILFYY